MIKALSQFVLGLLTSQLIFAANRGTDDRLAVTQFKSPPEKATVMAINKQDVMIDEATGTFQLKAINLNEVVTLCDDQKFPNAPMLEGNSCAGTVLAGNLNVTSAHCADDYVDPSTYCKQNYFISGVSVENYQQKFSVKDNLYSCLSVLVDGFKGVADVSAGQVEKFKDENDYLILKLDRAVPGSDQVPWRNKGTITEGTKVYSVGHPYSIPSIKAPGEVNYVDPLSGNIRTDIDSGPGFSGGGAFNETGQYEGIMSTDMHGDRAFHFDESGCARWAWAPPEDNEIYYNSRLTGAMFIPVSRFQDKLKTAILKELGVFEQLNQQAEAIESAN